MKEKRTLRELFSLPGFKAKEKLQGEFGDQKARIVELRRQKKDQYAQAAARVTVAITILRFDKCAISMRWDGAFISALNSGE